MSSWSLALPGQHQTRIGMPVRVTARPTTIWGRSGRWSFEWPKPRKPASPSLPASGSSTLEVGRGRIEEQEVDLEVEEVSRRPVDRLGQGLLDREQEVHRPVAGILIEAIQAGDRHPLGHPPGRSQLRERLEGPVTDEGEQHPLGAGIQPPAGEQPPQGRVDPEPAPETVEHVGAAHRPRVEERQLRGGGGGERLRRLERPRQRADQPLERRPVELVLPAEAVEHPDPRVARLGVPFVVGELEVSDDRAVPRPPLRGPEVHGYLASMASTPDAQGSPGESVYL